MVLAQAAGISPADANVLTKAIKKKKHDKVAAFKERFVPGFISYLKEKENADDELAEKTADDVWTVILNSASYLFNASHAYAMALDSLYGCYLKVHYPYEFYLTMLRLYSEKGNKEKVALIIKEMKAYKGITMIPGKFRQDNRDWYVDKRNGTIAQSLHSIKFVPASAADILYKMKDMEFDSFIDVLRYIQMNTSIRTNVIKILIILDYFSEFGHNGKLLQLYDEFFEGKNKVTKTIKSYEKRMAVLKEMENTMEDKTLSIYDVLPIEQAVLEMCQSIDIAAPNGTYFITNIDIRRSAYVTAYSVKTGQTGIIKVKKDIIDANPLEIGDFIILGEWRKVPKYIYKDGGRKPIPDQFEVWMSSYNVIHKSENILKEK